MNSPSKNKQRLVILDTTLRDGSQCRGVPLKVAEKLAVARRLSRLGVDIIEAGAPGLRAGETAAVHAIAAEIWGPLICAVSSCDPVMIKKVAAALKPAGGRARIHLYIGTSEVHRLHSGSKVEAEVLRGALNGISEARSHVDDVEFSAEDASRTSREFMEELCFATVNAGAATFNVADSAGCAMPDQYAAMVRHLYKAVPQFATGAAILSAHCHNDLGLAVANSLAAIRAGARQVECTINGVGERAGNAAMEEVVVALRARADFFGGLSCGINSSELLGCSRFVSRLTRIVVQPNKAVIGENAFAHCEDFDEEIHKLNKRVYRICDPGEVGWRTGTEAIPLTERRGTATHSTTKKQESHIETGRATASSRYGVPTVRPTVRLGSRSAAFHRSPPSPRGAVARDFELLKQIGRGSYGEVWLARSVTGAIRAIKIIERKNFTENRPFEREFEGLRQFEPISRSHAGWVSIFHVGKDDKAGYFYYVMEPADDVECGQDIHPPDYQAKSLSTVSKSLPEAGLRHSIQIGISLADSISRLHLLGFVHRDVKPSNIIFVNGRPKLADIGLVTAISRASTYLGTPGFIPPEGPGSPGADIFALGKVLYQAATGCAAGNFPGLPTSIGRRSDAETLVKFIRIINRACENNARRRYRDAETLCADLKKLATSIGM